MNERLVTISSIIGLTVATITAIVILSVFVPANTTAITIIISFIVPTITALLALINGQKTHDMVNSRLTELLATTKKLSYAEGKVEGIRVEEKREDRIS